MAGHHGYGTVLVVRVRGRTYFATRLKQRVAEICGNHLADLPIVQTFVHGWFDLIFVRDEHKNWVLSSY